MGFLTNRITDSLKNSYSFQDSDFFKMIGIDQNSIDKEKLGEITFFVCMKHLSETVSKFPIKLYQKTKKGKIIDNEHYLDYILNLEPNPYYNASTLWSSVELNKNYYGNAFIYIETHKTGKDRGRVKHLWLLPSDQVEILIDDKGIFGTRNNIWYIWTDKLTEKKYTFDMDEIIHIKTSMSFDGITGLAVKDILKVYVDTAKYGQSYLSKLYKNNMFGGKVILNYTGNLDDKGEKALAEKIESYSGKVGSGKFIPLPLGIEAKTLEMKLSDAEFSSLNKTNALMIASAFGIKPNILNIYDNSSYSNSETQQIDFYVNSLHPILNFYEQSLTTKLLTRKEKEDSYRFDFDTSEMFKTDFNTLIESASKAINNFIMTPQEAREKLGLSYKEGTDDLIGNGTFITLDLVKQGVNYNNQSTKGGE